MYNPTPRPFPDPNEQPETKHRKVNSIWKISTRIYILIALGLCFYWEFTDSGFCMTVREWQATIQKDSFSPLLDIMASFLLLLLPLFVAKMIVQKVTGVKIELGYKR